MQRVVEVLYLTIRNHMIGSRGEGVRPNILRALGDDFVTDPAYAVAFEEAGPIVEVFSASPTP